LPSAAEDHQTKNALSLTEKGAGILLKEPQAEERIAEEIAALVQSSEKRDKIIENLKAFRTDDATENIVKEVVRLIGEE
jgi:UDP-N-acetylglucosamine--N-acetylmuramyl-(pentapeptide) pyrophosphoryl-undecaprenol N-acetylglucosamine transferase